MGNLLNAVNPLKARLFSRRHSAVGVMNIEDSELTEHNGYQRCAVAKYTLGKSERSKRRVDVK